MTSIFSFLERCAEPIRTRHPKLGLSAHLKKLDGLRSNKASIKKLKSNIGNLISDIVLFFDWSDGQILSFNKPVVTEIPKSNRFFTRCRSGHKIGYQNWFSKDRIISASPEIIPACIFEFTECQGGLIVHDPHSTIAVFGFETEEQSDDFIKADAVCYSGSHTDFGTIGRMQNTVRLILTISINEGPFFFFSRSTSNSLVR